MQHIIMHNEGTETFERDGPMLTVTVQDAQGRERFAASAYASTAQQTRAALSEWAHRMARGLRR